MAKKMKIREKITIEKRKMDIFLYASIIACVPGFIVQNSLTIVLGLIGCVVFMVCLIFGYRSIRCPHCQGRIGYAISSSVPFKVSSKIHYCPFCGISIDSDIEENKEP
jgi:hypothetical protein